MDTSQGAAASDEYKNMVSMFSSSRAHFILLYEFGRNPLL